MLYQDFRWFYLKIYLKIYEKNISNYLCGGVGTRLWPISRKSYPKQFFNFFDKNCLFQKTIQRVRNNKFNKPVIVSNSEYRYIIKKKNWMKYLRNQNLSC